MMSEKQLNNTESKKLDSNSDEIIWELEHKKTLGFFYSWFARCVFFFGGIYYIVIGTQKYLSRDDNGLFITIILLILVAMWFMVSPLTLYKTLNGSKVIDLTFFDDRQFILADGSMIFLENNVWERTYISIDVNGYIKGPNRLGQDLFMFQLDTNGRLIPMGAEGTDYYSENDEYCSKTSTNKMNGAGCTYKALGDTKYFSSF